MIEIDAIISVSLIRLLQVKCYRIVLDLLQIALNIAKLKYALHLIWTYCYRN